MSAEYDGIADVYDQTRRALDAETAGGLSAFLLSHGCETLLEIGVGTGRVSVPLMEAGREVVGVDVSRRMMERARSKGLPNLLLADGTRTPFRDGSFDAVLLAHVLHIVEDPMALLREGARVGKVGVFALLRKGSGDRGEGPLSWSGSSAPEWDRRRAWFVELAKKYDWPVQGRVPRDWSREPRLLESNPPDELVEVSDAVVTDTVEARVERIRKGAYGFMAGMPLEMREEIAAEVRSRASLAPATPVHLVHQVAFWRPAKFPPRG